MEPKATSWESDGEPVTITTHKLPNEGDDVWCGRHEEAVAAAQSIWPPDPVHERKP